MIQVVVLLLLLWVVVMWWRGRQRKRAVSTADRLPVSPYHCVEVRAGMAACDPVLKLGGTRFLSAEAPVLPVQGCTSARCACSYVHHDDRRETMRRNPYGHWSNMPLGEGGERRSRRDRRRSREQPLRPSMAR